MLIAAGVISTIGVLVGVLLTALTLPGIWVMCLVAVVCTIWQPALYSPWTLGAALVLAILAEVAEGLSAAAGSARGGGSRAGVVGSIVGSLAGLVAGTVLIPIPLLGSILGGILGAGAGAFIAERGVAERGWGDSWKSGRGALLGRSLAIAVKTGFAVVTGIVLIVGAFWN